MATSTSGISAASASALPTSNAADDPLAAALAAAAELAKNGGALLLNPLAMHGLATAAAPPAAASSTSSGAMTSVTSNTNTQQRVLPPGLAAMISAAATAAASGSCSGSPTAAMTGDDDASMDHEEDDLEDGTGTSSNPNEEDAERRIARSRERNREHARKTRLRKKAQLETLQSRVKALQAESKILKQSLEECSIASILVGLSSGDDRESTIQALVKRANDIEQKEIFNVVAGKRKRFLSDASTSSYNVDGSGGDHRISSQPLEIDIDGKLTKIGGGRSHINWKSGMYKDENGFERQLTHEQLESLRRERNRMHAKMTRDRKKNFIFTIQQTIEELESSNKRMKAVLADVVHSHFKATTETTMTTTSTPGVPVGVTPTASPSLIPKLAAIVQVPALAPAMPVAPPAASAPTTTQRSSEPLVEARSPSSITPPPATKRVLHGFSSPVY
ncbi:MAG: hypothetical protein SGILL_000264 [Bacillariaceae sp.]